MSAISFPMKQWEVRALLAGRLTQFRRLVKPQPDSGPNGKLLNLGGNEWGLSDGDLAGSWTAPYQPGDQLVGKETWATDLPVIYKADGANPDGLYWRSPAIMPDWASRFRLTVTEVRCQRVQDITKIEAWNCGCIVNNPGGQYRDDRHLFAETWNAAHGRGAWDRNDWVWAITVGPTSGPRGSGTGYAGELTILARPICASILPAMRSGVISGNRSSSGPALSRTYCTPAARAAEMPGISTCSGWSVSSVDTACFTVPREFLTAAPMVAAAAWSFMCDCNHARNTVPMMVDSAPTTAMVTCVRSIMGFCP